MVHWERTQRSIRFIAPGILVIAGVVLLVLVTGVAAGQPNPTGPAATGPDHPDPAGQHAGQTLTLDPIELGNVFRTSETPRVRVRSSADRVAWRVTNYWDEEVASGTTTLEGGVTVLEMPLETTGYYRLHVRAGDREATTTLGIVPDDGFENDDRFFGVSPAPGNGELEKKLSLLDVAGTSTIRQVYRWDVVEPREGEYNFSHNYMFNRMHEASTTRYGFEPFPILAFSNPVRVSQPEEWPFRRAPHTEAQREAFADYARATVAHYGEDVQAVEVWNEYNHGSFATGPAAHDPAEYARLLEHTYPAVKEGDSTVDVVGGATASFAFEWWRSVFQNGGGEYVDAMSVHQYPDTLTDLERDVERLRRISRNETGQTFPIWITEIGGDSHTAADVHGQAGFVVESHTRARSVGVKRLYWFNVIGGPYQCHRGCRWFSLLHDGDTPEGAYTPKPSYSAYAITTRQLAGTSVGERRSEPVNVYSFQTSAGTPRRVLWDMERTDVTVETTQPLEVTDLMGNTQTLSPVDGAVYLTVGPDPLYLTGAIEGIETGTPMGIRGGVGARGDVVPLSVQADTPTTALIASERIEMRSERRRVTIPATFDTERPVAVATLRRDGSTIGRMSAALTVRPDPVVVSARPRFDEAGTAVSIGLRNIAHRQSYRPTEIHVEVDDRRQSVTVDGGLEPNTSRTVDVPIESVPRWKQLNASVTVTFEDRSNVTDESTLTYAPIAKRPITVDGDLETLESVPQISLLDHGTIKLENYTGSSDLSGDVWLTYDEEHLYVSAAVTDDHHATGWPLWRHDSLQLGVGLAGTENYSEFEIALSPDGPRIFRKYQPSGPPAAVLQSASVEVERREATDRTVYEAAIPWEDLRTDPSRPTKLSLLVNDNDGQGREGWIEWGGGIGRQKDASVFPTVSFLEDASPVGSTASRTTSVGGADTGDATSPPGPTETSSPGFGAILALAILLGTVLTRRRR